LQQASAAFPAAARRGGGGGSHGVAAIDPSRGPAPPRPLLLAVVVEMGHDGSMVAAGGGSGPDLGLALTLTLTRRQEAMAGGGGRLHGSAIRAWRRGRHRQGRGVRRLTPRRWRAAACPTPMGLASGARCAAGADPPPRISSRRRASALGAIHCSPSSQGRRSLAMEP